MVMMAREMEIRAEGRAEAQQEAAERIAREFGISLEKAKEILTRKEKSE